MIDTKPIMEPQQDYVRKSPVDAAQPAKHLRMTAALTLVRPAAGAVYPAGAGCGGGARESAQAIMSAGGLINPRTLLITG